jgi:hypothetical protein
MTYDHHVVEKGKWFRNEARRFGRSQIGCDFGKRPIMTRAETLRWRYRMAQSHLLNLLPWRKRRQFIRFLRSMDLLGPMGQSGAHLSLAPGWVAGESRGATGELPYRPSCQTIPKSKSVCIRTS